MNTKKLKLLSDILTPCYVTDEEKLISNLKILNGIERQAGCKILLAQKAFSQYSLYKLIGNYISGTTASGLNEARLGYEEMGKENHVFSPAYLASDIDKLSKICDHIVFNSISQWIKYKNRVSGKVSCGIRVNPEKSTQDRAIYDPCAPFSRFGVTLANFKPELLTGIEGLHFHCLCEQNADALEITIEALLEKFGEFSRNMRWVNFGGGHHITREDYDIDKLVDIIKRVRREHNVEVYLEPGEAVALNAGYLVSTVLEIVENGMNIAILDVSATCHMPDVLEMPYRPNIIFKNEKGGNPGEKKHTFRLAGNTCLAGDIIGDYSFSSDLNIGDKLIFLDMAIYTMVKNNTFNGTPLPSIAVLHSDNNIEITNKFGYENFKSRI